MIGWDPLTVKFANPGPIETRCTQCDGRGSWVDTYFRVCGYCDGTGTREQELINEVTRKLTDAQ